MFVFKQSRQRLPREELPRRRLRRERPRQGYQGKSFRKQEGQEARREITGAARLDLERAVLDAKGIF